MIVDCAVYEDGRRRQGDLALDDAYEAGREDGAFVWIGLHEPSEEEFDSVAREFNLHELAVEDAIKAQQRPKLEVYGDSLFMVLAPACYSDEEEMIELGQIMLFVGEGFIVSVRHGKIGPLDGVRRELESRPELVRCGPAFVLYAILDHVVDDYLPVSDELDRDIQQVETAVFSSVPGQATERIYKLKGEVIDFHRALSPLVEPLRVLAGARHPQIPDELGSYFRDVYDHLLRANEQVDGYREELTSVLQANLAQVSVRQNEDTRRISAWVAIVAVPTAIAGIYGMNFENMPELKWTYGYPMVLGIILVVCTSLYVRFKRSGWL
ncbi:MAG: magnesium/cobalt transporter CorA [Thermoleophilaceae bacterium]